MKLFLFLMGCNMAMAAGWQDFDELWDYSKPAETEVKFRELLPQAEKAGGDPHLQLLTQIARTHSLRSQFKEAHALLDQVEKKLGKATPVAEIRYLLERGRTFNSDNKKAEAIALFEKAYQLGLARKEEFHTIDAAHMLGIAEKMPKQMEWNLKAVELTEKTKDERAKKWLASLYNNIGWSLHEQGKFQEALEMFQKALPHWEKKGPAANIRFARWTIGRALRSSGRADEAMKIQRALEAENEKLGEPDGYVYEEIAELLLAGGKKSEAKPYFAKAAGELSKDEWFKKNEAKRLERMLELSK